MKNKTGKGNKAATAVILIMITAGLALLLFPAAGNMINRLQSKVY